MQLDPTPLPDFPLCTALGYRGELCRREALPGECYCEKDLQIGLRKCYELKQHATVANLLNALRPELRIETTTHHPPPPPTDEDPNTHLMHHTSTHCKAIDHKQRPCRRWIPTRPGTAHSLRNTLRLLIRPKKTLPAERAAKHTVLEHNLRFLPEDESELLAATTRSHQPLRPSANWGNTINKLAVHLTALLNTEPVTEEEETESTPAPPSDTNRTHEPSQCRAELAKMKTLREQGHLIVVQTNLRGITVTVEGYHLPRHSKLHQIITFMKEGGADITLVSETKLNLASEKELTKQLREWIKREPSINMRWSKPTKRGRRGAMILWRKDIPYKTITKVVEDTHN